MTDERLTTGRVELIATNQAVPVRAAVARDLAADLLDCRAALAEVTAERDRLRAHLRDSFALLDDTMDESVDAYGKCAYCGGFGECTAKCPYRLLSSAAKAGRHYR